MSVRTTADDAKENAKDHISEAYKALLIALDEETWGSGDFNKEYIAKMEESLLALIRMKRDL